MVRASAIAYALSIFSRRLIFSLGSYMGDRLSVMGTQLGKGRMVLPTCLANHEIGYRCLLLGDLGGLIRFRCSLEVLAQLR